MRIRLYHKKQKGQGIVEFALILPIVLLVTLGIMQLGHFMFFWDSINTASQEAVRYGAALGTNSDGVLRYKDCTGIRNAAKRIALTNGLVDADIDIAYDHGPGTADFATACPPTTPDVVLGDRIKVTVHSKYYPFVPLVGIGEWTVNAQASYTILKEITVY